MTLIVAVTGAIAGVGRAVAGEFVAPQRRLAEHAGRLLAVVAGTTGAAGLAALSAPAARRGKRR